MATANEINSLMRTIMIEEQRTYEQLTVDFNVTQPQARTMEYLKRNPGVNQKQIAAEFDRREASISGLLKNLEKNGYIEKRNNAGMQDRSKKVYLTESGLDVTNQMKKLFDSVENSVTTGLSEKESDLLRDLLIKIQQEIKSK